MEMGRVKKNCKPSLSKKIKKYVYVEQHLRAVNKVISPPTPQQRLASE